MIRLEQLTKAYGDGPDRTVVLDRLDLTVDAGTIAAVVGPSGAGKSTLAQCVTLLERPTSGSVVVDGRELAHLDERSLRAARRQIGTIFQADGLLSRRTAAENVALPLRYLGVTPGDRRRRVAELLERVGLSSRAQHYPHQLSGGQRQRVGIARALALRPSVLLADEATSGLDPDSTASIVALLRQLRTDLGLAVLFITHEMDTVVQVADTASRLDHGRIVESGAVVDLLRDPASSLGAALMPRRPHAELLPSAPGAGSVGGETWFVSYVAQDVPADWVLRAAADLGACVAVLGASIASVAGHTVGHATISLQAAAETGRPLDPARVSAVLGALGLAARREAPAASGTSTTPGTTPTDDAHQLETVA